MDGGDGMDYAALAKRVSRLHCSHLRQMYMLADTFAVQGEAGVLLCLHQQGDSMLSGELMERMGLTTGRIANILKQMEQKGLIARCHDSGDRRRVYVSLTELGASCAEERLRQMNEAHVRILENLGEEDAKELVRLMERCLDFMGDTI